MPFGEAQAGSCWPYSLEADHWKLVFLVSGTAELGANASDRLLRSLLLAPRVSWNSQVNSRILCQPPVLASRRKISGTVSFAKSDLSIRRYR